MHSWELPYGCLQRVLQSRMTEKQHLCEFLVTDFFEGAENRNSKKTIFTKNKTRSGNIKIPLGLLGHGASG